MIRSIGVVLVLAFVAAACGGTDGGSDGGADGAQNENSGGETAEGVAADNDGEGDLEPLRVGLLLATSGPAAPFGQAEVEGAIAILEQAIETDALGGRGIEYFEADTETDPTMAARRATELIEDHNVHAIIGATIGQSTLAYAPVAAQAEVPILATNGTISVTSKDNDFWPWIFRAAPSDLISAEAVLNGAVENGATRIGVFAQEDAYGEDTLNYVQDLVAEMSDVEIVEVARGALDATDLSAQASRLRNAEPDAILMMLSPPALGATLVRAMAQVGVDVPVWGMIGLSQQSFIEAAGPAANGVRTVAMAHWADPSPGMAELAAMLEERGWEAGSFEVAGSNGAEALVQAVATIEDADLTGAKVRDALTNLCPFDTLAPGEDVCYTEEDRDGYGSDSLVPLVVQDSEFVRLDM